MNTSNAWAEFAAVFLRTRQAHLEHEESKAELKTLMPDDAKEAIGQSGAISFGVLTNAETGDAAL